MDLIHLTLAASHLHCTAGSSRSFTAIQKDAGLYCGPRLRKGEVFAYGGLSQNLKDLKDFVIQVTLCTEIQTVKQAGKARTFLIKSEIQIQKS